MNINSLKHVYVKFIHAVTKTEFSVFGRQALDAERRRSPSLADTVLTVLLASSHNQALLHDKPTRRDMNPLIYLSSGPHVLTFRYSVGNVWC